MYSSSIFFLSSSYFFWSSAVSSERSFLPFGSSLRMRISSSSETFFSYSTARRFDAAESTCRKVKNSTKNTPIAEQQAGYAADRAFGERVDARAAGFALAVPPLLRCGFAGVVVRRRSRRCIGGFGGAVIDHQPVVGDASARC